MQFEVIVD